MRDANPSSRVRVAGAGKSAPVRLWAWGFGLIAAVLAIARVDAAVNPLPEFERLVDTNVPAVVSIEVQPGPSPAAMSGPDANVPEFLQRFFGPMPRHPMPPRPGSPSGGSGFIISADGYILSNAHVVDGGGDIVVRLHDRREFPARLVGKDARTDVAVLKIEASGLPVVRFGDSNGLRVGQWVLAIGAPFGFEHTATQGIISALGRNLPADQYVPFIQTDVALNPGNSGGPLFNLEGEVIGMNSQIFSRTGGYMGLSFAIPVNLAREIAAQLTETGRIERGWLGIGIQSLDQALAESFDLDVPRGALVTGVIPDSPAAGAELRPGDIILDFDGKPVSGAPALPPMVAATPVDSQVVVRVLRNGKQQNLTVTVGRLEEPVQQASVETRPGRLGFSASDLTGDERAAAGVSDGGARVDQVHPDSAAARAGLRQNDVIVSFNHERIDNAAELAALAAEIAPGTSVPVLVQRDKGAHFLALRIPEGAG